MSATRRTFRDRREAGRFLAEKLAHNRGRDDVQELCQAPGGVPVGWEVASFLRAPLDACLVRKLGVPQWPELAMGAVATAGGVVLNEDLLGSLDISDEQIRDTLTRETAELHRREEVYRAGRGALLLAGRTVILVDDGIATGASMTAAVRSVRSTGPAHIVVAVPVGPASVCRRLRADADDVVCSTTPRDFRAVGQVYEDFHQVSDDEVRDLLATPTVDRATTDG